MAGQCPIGFRSKDKCKYASRFRRMDRTGSADRARKAPLTSDAVRQPADIAKPRNIYSIDTVEVGDVLRGRLHLSDDAQR